MKTSKQLPRRKKTEQANHPDEPGFFLTCFGFVSNKVSFDFVGFFWGANILLSVQTWKYLSNQLILKLLVCLFTTWEALNNMSFMTFAYLQCVIQLQQYVDRSNQRI